MAQPLSIIARKPARSTIRRDAEDQKYFFFFLITMNFQLRLLISLVQYILS